MHVCVLSLLNSKWEPATEVFPQDQNLQMKPYKGNYSMQNQCQILTVRATLQIPHRTGEAAGMLHRREECLHRDQVPQPPAPG